VAPTGRVGLRACRRQRSVRPYSIDVCTPLAYIARVANHCTIVETPTFTRLVTATLGEEEYRALQLELARNPKAGAVIPGSGGLRKIRWAGGGRGKRSGFRVIYYWLGAEQTVLMLYLFAKNEADDLTKDQLKVLARIVKEEYP
jgi:mRNA-degrading endonuclease RelE of RelBE toxin-antitoxin system